MKGHYCLLLAGALVLLSLPAVAVAQTAPLQQHTEPYAIDSGRHDGHATEAVAYRAVVEVADAPWLRLTFSDAALGDASYLTVTSLLDGARQRLDATALAQWYRTSAYFNGDAVEVALHVAPGDEGVFFRIDEVVVGEPGEPESQCGPTDDRTNSDDPKAGRLLSVGCTAWIIHDEKIVSAGHCTQSGASTLQFNVPLSTAGGQLQHPGPEDQYSVDQASRVFVNGGIGNDWGVFRVFDNTQTGLQPVEAQGASFLVRQDLAPPTIRITGYGVDTGEDNQAQQTHTGPNAGSSGTTMRYQVDTTGGNSGSPVIDEATGEAVGVHTHGGCTTGGSGSNSGTSLFNTAFWNAIGTPPPPMADACFTTLSGALTANVDLDEARDIFYGVGSGATTYQVSGARGTNGRTLRHHNFEFMNPAAGNDPGCGDGAGVVDWLAFNGRVTGGGGGTYNWNGHVVNSCGFTDSETGTITLGACPAPRQAMPAGDDAQRVPPAHARVDVPRDDAAASLVAAFPEGGLTYCYTNTAGYQHEGTVDDVTDVLSGPGDTGAGFDWHVHGGRGTTSRELRHHDLVWQNPNADDDPDCSDAAGNTDWFTYNGLVSGSAPSYTFNAVWRNSCDVTGTRSGTITIGPCPAPLAGSPAPGPEALVAAVVPPAAAGAEVAQAGVAVVSGPNPFRSSTTIIFALDEGTHVRLAVYDMLGREIAVLVDEERAAGTHSAVFEAGALPAGTYLYRLEAGSHAEAKPMVLVR